jgi:hypothetical protein
MYHRDRRRPQKVQVIHRQILGNRFLTLLAELMHLQRLHRHRHQMRRLLIRNLVLYSPLAAALRIQCTELHLYPVQKTAFLSDSNNHRILGCCSRPSLCWQCAGTALSAVSRAAALKTEIYNQAMLYFFHYK